MENEKYAVVLEDLEATDLKDRFKGVTEMGEDGTPKRSNLDDGNTGKFLIFNSNMNPLEAFWENFVNGYKNGAKFRLIGMGVGALAFFGKKLKEMTANLKQNGGKINEKELKKLFDELEKSHNIKILDTDSKVNWKQLAKYGVTPELLKERGEYESFLRGERTRPLSMKTPTLFGKSKDLGLEACLSLVKRKDGSYEVMVDPVRKEVKLDLKFGEALSEEDKKRLFQEGNLGRLVPVKGADKKFHLAYVSIDPDTNKVVAMEADKIKLSSTLGGKDLDPESYAKLVKGEAVFVEGLKTKSGESFDAWVQVNAYKKKVEIIYEKDLNYKERHEINNMIKDLNFSEIPQKIKGKSLDIYQRRSLAQGRAIYLDSLKSYVMMDKVDMTVKSYKYNPTVAPGGRPHTNEEILYGKSAPEKAIEEMKKQSEALTRLIKDESGRVTLSEDTRKKIETLTRSVDDTLRTMKGLSKKDLAKLSFNKDKMPKSIKVGKGSDIKSTVSLFEKNTKSFVSEIRKEGNKKLFSTVKASKKTKTSKKTKSAKMDAKVSSMKL